MLVSRRRTQPWPAGTAILLINALVGAMIAASYALEGNMIAAAWTAVAGFSLGLAVADILSGEA